MTKWWFLWQRSATSIWISWDTVDFSPFYWINTGESQNASIDPSWNLVTRSLILTDEWWYTTNFSGSELYIVIPDCIFTNGSDLVTTTADLTQYMFQSGDYVKFNSDADTKYRQIDSIEPTKIYLKSAYTGTGGTGNMYVSKEQPKIWTGSTITIANGVCTMASGTTDWTVVELERDVDIYPITVEREINISQRITNTDIQMWLYDDVISSPRYWAFFKFTGTNNNLVICETAFTRSWTPAATDTPIATILIPAWWTVALASVFNLGIRFWTGIAHLIVTGMALTDATAVAAWQVSVHLSYV